MQGPFSAEHMKVLRESGAVQDDTLVMAAAKGPSLLKEVLQMPAQHRASPYARSAARGLRAVTSQKEPVCKSDRSFVIRGCRCMSSTGHPPPPGLLPGASVPPHLRQSLLASQIAAL